MKQRVNGLHLRYNDVSGKWDYDPRLFPQVGKEIEEGKLLSDVLNKCFLSKSAFCLKASAKASKSMSYDTFVQKVNEKLIIFWDQLPGAPAERKIVTSLTYKTDFFRWLEDQANPLAIPFSRYPDAIFKGKFPCSQASRRAQKPEHDRHALPDARIY